MARLTNEKRDSILETEINNKFYDSINSLNNELRGMIEKEIKKTVPKWITDEIKSSGYIKTSDDLSLDRSNLSDEVYKKLNYFQIDYIPCHRYSHKYIPSKSVINKVNKILDLEEKRKTFSRELKQILYCYTTDAALLKVVPELKDYFKDDNSKKQAALVPLDQISRVRKALGVNK